MAVQIFLLATSGWPGWGRVKHTPATIFDIAAPVLPEGTTVAVAGEPVGFVVPFLQGQDLQFVGLSAPPHTRLDREIAARIVKAAPLRVLMLGGDAQASRQLAQFDIAPDVASCVRITTHRRDWGPVLLCKAQQKS